MIQLLSEDEFYTKAMGVPLQRLNWSLAATKQVDVWVRRDDLIDKYVSGNKFYKLFYNLHAAKQQGYQQILSFGGAYSNHIYALAAAAHVGGFKTVGVIRGERPKQLSPTLMDAEAWGMRLHFVSRAEYSRKQSEQLQLELTQKYGDFFVIPEGGANEWGVKGTCVLGQVIKEQLNSNYTAVCLASGTANTLAGVALGMTGGCEGGQVMGFSVLKGEGNSQVPQHQQAYGNQSDNWRLISGYHGGGYAKKLPENISQFFGQFERETALQIDPVYTLKMFWGVAQLLEQNYWPKGSRLVLIHTGGLQGRRGFGLDYC